MLTIGEPEDPLDDATLPWPADRKSVDAGTLTLTSIETERAPATHATSTSIPSSSRQASNHPATRC